MTMVATHIDREVRFGDFRYPFCVRSGEQSWIELKQRAAELRADRFVIVTDPGVPVHFVGAVESCFEQVAPTRVYRVANSERSKTIQTVDRIAEQALHGGITRSSVIVALGGGLTGNVAGLLAALLFRGIRLVHMPTTLLGMSDSVLSLKQAVNSRVGKNHLGTFHAPVLVWNQLDFLATLPPQEIRAALCETIKNVLAICPDRYDEVAAKLNPDGRYPPHILAEFIDLCVDAKTTVMGHDPLEKHEAVVLEYGHTVGHAAELLSDGKLPHGYAIGIGMLVAARVSRQLGLLDAAAEAAHRSLLERNGAPTVLSAHLTTDAILTAVRRDNKRGYMTPAPGVADLVLLAGLGRPHRTGDDTPITQVDEDVLRSAVDSHRTASAAGAAEHETTTEEQAR